MGDVMTPAEYHARLFMDAKANVYAQSTIELYLTVLREISAVMGDEWPPTPALVAKYLAGLRQRGLATATAHNYFTNVRAWLYWLVKHGYLDDNPALKVEKPPKPDTLPRAPDLDRLQKFFDHLEKAVADSPGRWRWRTMRDLAMLSLIFDCGLRQSEARKLRFEDVTFVDDPDIGGHCHITKTKTRRDRVVPFSPYTRRNLERWYEERPNCRLKHIFVTYHHGEWRRIGREAVLKKHQKYVKDAGLAYFDVHALRHAAAVAMLDKQMPLNRLMIQLGHRRLETTARYLLVAPSSIDQFYRAASPMKAIKEGMK